MSLAIRIALALWAVIWLPYGIYCFFAPTYLNEIAGVNFVSATGTTELRAMYGGLQAGIGAMCLAALWRSTLVVPALTLHAFLCAGLGLFRVGGLALDGGLSSYTAMALFFEFGSATAAIILLSRRMPKG